MKRVTEQSLIQDLLREFDSSFFTTMEEMSIDITLWAEKLANKGSVYVKEENGNRAGLLIFYANDEETYTSFLSYIAVKEEYKGRHFGDGMILFWMDCVKEMGYKYCRLEVDRKNEHAIHFYEKHGFVIEEDAGDSFFMKREV